MCVTIHPSAVIEDGAHFGDNVTVGPFCHVGASVTLGDNTTLHAHVILQGDTRIENDCHIFSCTTIGSSDAPVHIEACTTIREFCQIGIEGESSQPVHVGESNFIMAYTKLYRGVVLGERCVLTNLVTLKENVHCDKSINFGGLSTIERDIRVGSNVMIGGASTVKEDLPPFCLIEGNPSHIRGLNIIGLRRRFENKSTIDAIKKAFRVIVREHDCSPEKAQEISKQSEEVQVRYFAEFIAQKQKTPSS